MKKENPSVDELRRSMEGAAARGDFEIAAQLRDRISLMRVRLPFSLADDFDPSGLDRQKPGAMGLGTSQQKVTPPPGWIAPRKPDPMTSGKARPRRKTKK